MTPDDYSILSTPAYPALYKISQLMERKKDYNSPFFLISQDLFADAFVELVKYCAKTGCKISMYEGELEKNNFLFKGWFVTFYEEEND
jgi:hypothetical protein